MTLGQLRRGSAALLCAAAVAIGPTTPAHATNIKAPLHKGDIVYSVAPDDTTLGDLWLVRSDGTGATQLTTSGTAISPSWSANGRRLAFVQDGDVWVMTPATGATRRLTHTGGAETPVWSPDGTSIAYVRADEVWTVRVSSSQAVRVSWTATIGCGVTSRPDWTPNGQSVVYNRAARSGDQPCNAGVARQRPGDPARLLLPGVPARSLAYTEDGSHLLYLAPCDGEPCFTDGVFEVNPDGTDAHRILGSLDQNWDCFMGAICVSDIKAAPAGGWVESGVFANDDGDPPHTCFEGVVESAPGEATLTDDPSFCVSGIARFDVR